MVQRLYIFKHKTKFDNYTYSKECYITVMFFELLYIHENNLITLLRYYYLMRINCKYGRP